MSKRKAPTDDDAGASASASTTAAPTTSTPTPNTDTKHNGTDATAVADGASYDGVKKPRTAGPERPPSAADTPTSVVMPKDDKPAPLTSSGAIIPTAGMQTGGGTMVHVPENRGQLIVAKDQKVSYSRTSSLMAPTMLLTGHGGPVMCARFNPAGTYVASGSQDKLILLWKTYGECQNFATLSGHKNTVLSLCWSRDGDQLYTASADNTGATWDVEAGTRVRRFREHTSHVNSVATSRKGDPLVVTCSDDCKAITYDVRVKRSISTFETEYQMLAVAMSDDSSRVYTGGLDGVIRVWDRRAERELFAIDAHTDAITDVQISPDGNHVLSNGMDAALRIWDVRPYVSATQSTRLVHSFSGAKHDMQKNLLKCAWSADGARVTCGSSDRLVNVWDVNSKRLLYRLPGHGGCVNEVAFHPIEPIIVSASEDKKLFVGEINP